MITKLILATILLVTGLKGFAGDVGNGGVSVVCNSASGSIHAELLDIYEGKIRYQRKYPKKQINFERMIDLAQFKLIGYPTFMQSLIREISKVKENLVFVPAGHTLLPTDDAFPVITKKGCHFEQVANYTNDGIVLVSKEIYDQLDNLNKAALYLHEAIYAIRREFGDIDSQFTRKLVAQLLATNSNQEVIDTLVEQSTQQQPRSSSRTRSRSRSASSACGLKGSIEDRIEDCSQLDSSSKNNFILVTRTENSKEIYKDIRSNLLWGDLIHQDMNGPVADIICTSQLIQNDLGNIQAKWRLPTIQEFKNAESNGMTSALPNLNYKFWSSDMSGHLGMTYTGNTGNVEFCRSDEICVARCVSAH